ncbi:hypothetical protein J2Z35_002528 [Acetoanaerobium pronyense]|uniref:Phage gp6-like head-tail connector protein n=1 Tax=Acetoanaerobium pronyense TaxID=1482736 RepID=A0ABS4KLN4_9FIRM|nr:hypothetical protein [Acetoanaerobium pronyense]
MVVTLEDTKLWLRVEHADEDALIESLITASQEIVEYILRFSLNDFEGDIPESIKHAIFFTVSKFYEERNEIDMNELKTVLKFLLSSYRKEIW